MKEHWTSGSECDIWYNGRFVSNLLFFIAWKQFGRLLLPVAILDFKMAAILNIDIYLSLSSKLSEVETSYQWLCLCLGLYFGVVSTYFDQLRWRPYWFSRWLPSKNYKCWYHQEKCSYRVHSIDFTPYLGSNKQINRHMNSLEGHTYK